MAFAGYGETQRRRARFHRGTHKRGARYGRGLVVLGCVPSTLPNLCALVLTSLVTVFILASRINHHNRSVEPGSAGMSSWDSLVGSRGMRTGTGGGGVVPELLGVNRVTDANDRNDGVGPSSAFCARPRDPTVCAHGTVGSAYWPSSSHLKKPLPNTVPALAAVVAAGHVCVEVDVSRTKDGHLVALHSRELKVLTNGAFRNVGDLSLAEITSLHIPGGGYQIATFAEAMAVVMGRGLAQITIDFKEDEIGNDRDARGKHSDEPMVDVVQETFGVAKKTQKDRHTNTQKYKNKLAGFGLAVLSTIAAVDETGTGCRECVFWGKSDSIMEEILAENNEASVGFTVANFSVAIRDAGLDSMDPLKRPLIQLARRRSKETKVVAAVQSEMIDSGTMRKVRSLFPQIPPPCFRRPSLSTVGK